MAFSVATKIDAGRTAIRNRPSLIHRSRPFAPSATPAHGTVTRGSRLGRISSPIAVQTPARKARSRAFAGLSGSGSGRRDATSAPVQNAAAGTSLIGQSAWNNTTGLTERISAADKPAIGPAARLPRLNVSHTRSAVQI